MTLEDNIVSTSTQYFEKLGITEDKIDWDETGNPELISMKEYDMIEEIIALQVSFWCLRSIGTSGEYKKLLNKWFVDPTDMYNKLDDVENVCVYKISNTEFKVLAFSDGYDGYLFTFGVEDGKLKELNGKKILDEDDSIYEKDELSDSEIEDILC